MTGIPDCQLHIRPCLEISGDGDTVSRQVNGLQAYFDDAASLAHRMGRIRAEVEYDLVYLRWVGQYRSGVGVNDRLYSNS